MAALSDFRCLDVAFFNDGVTVTMTHRDVAAVQNKLKISFLNSKAYRQSTDLIHNVGFTCSDLRQQREVISLYLDSGRQERGRGL